MRRSGRRIAKSAGYRWSEPLAQACNQVLAPERRAGGAGGVMGERVGRGSLNGALVEREGNMPCLGGRLPALPAWLRAVARLLNLSVERAERPRRLAPLVCGC